MLSFLKNLKEKHDFKTIFLYSSWAITLTSGLSYVLGYVRDKLLTGSLDAGVSDVFKAAFSLPELLQNLLIVAALSAGFVPIFSKKYDEDKEAGYRYSHQIMSWGVALLMVGIIISIIFLPYFASFFVEGFTGEKLEKYIEVTRVLLIGSLIFGISNIFGQVLISMKEFFWWGLSPVLNNIGVLFGILVLYPKLGLMGAILGALLGAFLHLLIRLIIVKRRKFKFTLKPDFRLSPEMKETFLLAYPKIPQYALYQIMIAKFGSIATTFPEGSVTIHDIAFNFKSMPVGFLGVAIAWAMFPELSRDAAEGNFKKFKHDFRKNRFKTIFYTVIAAGLMAIFSHLMISILFSKTNVELMSGLLMVYCISVPFDSLLQIYHRAFYSLKNTFIPSFLHCITIGLTIGLAYFLIPHVGLYCLPLSTAIALVFHISAVSILFPILLKKKEAEFLLKNS